MNMMRAYVAFVDQSIGSFIHITVRPGCIGIWIGKHAYVYAACVYLYEYCTCIHAHARIFIYIYVGNS